MRNTSYKGGVAHGYMDWDLLVLHRTHRICGFDCSDLQKEMTAISIKVRSNPIGILGWPLVAAPLFLHYTAKTECVNENQNRPNVDGSGFLGFQPFSWPRGNGNLRITCLQLAYNLRVFFVRFACYFPIVEWSVATNLRPACNQLRDLTKMIQIWTTADLYSFFRPSTTTTSRFCETIFLP